jgi:hypothetical protein
MIYFKEVNCTEPSPSVRVPAGVKERGRRGRAEGRERERKKGREGMSKREGYGKEGENMMQKV